MANKAWTRTTLGLALAGELNCKAGVTVGTVPSQIEDAILASFDALWKREPCRFALRRATLTWGTDKDVLRIPSTWTGATPTLAGAYTGTKLDCYTFTASASGTVGTTVSLALTVTDFDGAAVGTLAIGSTYTPGTAITVANGITISLPAGTVTSAQAFYVDLKHDLALLPLWDYPGDSTRALGNFRKLDPDWIEENNNNGSIRFTQDISLFIEHEQSLDGQTSIPELALIEPDQERSATTTGKFNWRCRLSATPSQEVSYTIYYLCYAPTLAATHVPVWPDFMHEQWEADSKWRALKKLNRDSWKEAYAHYKAGQGVAINEENETQSSSTPDIHDAGDTDGFLSGGEYG
jgi:hypothetical protein